jgi:hypothetical protein
MMPFEVTSINAVPGYYSVEKDARRQTFNEWVRTSKAYDGVVDFDRVVRDPEHTIRVLPLYKSADNLHLNDVGYQTLANAIDLRMLANSRAQDHTPVQASKRPGSFLSSLFLFILRIFRGVESAWTPGHLGRPCK